MPWDVFPEGDQLCVYKLDADKKPTGSSLECYPKSEEAKARAYVRALYANADDATKEIGKQIKAVLDPLQYAYITPRRFGFLEFKQKSREGVTIFKDTATGLRWMFIVTSNAYQDRDQETITTKALAHYVDRAWAIEDKCIPDNTLLLWHKGDPIGDIIWTDMEGPFLIEVARERPNQLINIKQRGKALSVTIRDIWDAIESANETWGASHGFKYPESAKTKDGTYHYIAKFETSILPRAAASNPYTFAGVINDMDRDSFLDNLLSKVPGVKARVLRQGVAKLNEELQKQGLQHKEHQSDDDKTAVKGLVEAMIPKIDKTLSGISDSPSPDLRNAIIAIVVNELMAVSTELASEVDEPADELQTEIASQGSEDKPMPNVTDEQMNKQLAFMQRLITTQEQLADDNKATREVVTQLTEVVKSLTKDIPKLPGELEKLEERQKALENRLTGAPRRASMSDSTVVTDDKLTEQARKQTERFEEPLPGLKLKVEG